MYYRLSSDTVTETVFLTRVSHPFESLMKGKPLPEDTPRPFEFSMEVDLDEDGEIVPVEMPMFISEPCVMHVQFLRLLQEAGVDNIQAFPAVLTDARSNETFSDYVAANVIGLVSCAVQGQSVTSPLADVVYFHRLTLDPQRARGQLLFRLAESQMEIIVHETVARAIEARGIAGVTLEPVDEVSVP